jgi:hypothetical protein
MAKYRPECVLDVEAQLGEHPICWAEGDCLAAQTSSAARETTLLLLR